jgi:hypothetical protein
MLCFFFVASERERERERERDGSLFLVMGRFGSKNEAPVEFKEELSQIYRILFSYFTVKHLFKILRFFFKSNIN